MDAAAGSPSTLFAIMQYTISPSNNGGTVAVYAVLEDALPPSVTIKYTEIAQTLSEAIIALNFYNTLDVLYFLFFFIKPITFGK